MKIITAKELKERLDRNEVLLVDVREPSEHQSEYIEGASSIPLAEISLENMPNTSQPIVIHCLSGRRSADACAKLLSENSTLEIYTLDGGISAWKNAGLSTKSVGRKVLPLDRQVFFAVGLIVFSGVLFGALIHPGFYALSGFMGLGLMYSGLSGYCGMALLLTKMPWNK